MKQFLLLIVIFCGSLALFGQEEDILNKKLSFGVKDHWRRMNANWADGSITIFYNIVDFPNAAERESIKEKWNFGYNIRASYFPFIADITMFRGKYKANNIYHPLYYEPDKYYTFSQRNGYQLALSFCPLPYIIYGLNKKNIQRNIFLRQLSQTVVLYAGFGYQWSKLVLEKNTDYASNLNLAAMLWKTGCNIYIDKLPFDIVLEYMQTMHSDKRKNFSFISVGLSLSVVRLQFYGEKTPEIYID